MFKYKFNLHSSLKLIWFTLVSILLGPLALWFVMLGKKHRRGIAPYYYIHFSSLTLAYLSLQLLFFFVPIHWAILILIYLCLSFCTVTFIFRGEGSHFFVFINNENEEGKGEYFVQKLLAVGLASYPIVYIFALLRNISELDGFSILLPSDVYTHGLKWMILATPVILLTGVLVWKLNLRPSLRKLVYFYGGLVVVLLWMMIWERFDLFLSSNWGQASFEPLFFAYDIEIRYRQIVKFLFYAGAFLLGTGYLLGSGRTSVFIKRSVFLALPSFLLYANLLFVLGDWNHYYSAFRNRLLTEQHFQMYRLAARAQITRTPQAFQTPSVLEQWVEMEYQIGQIEKAKYLLQELEKRSGAHRYHARIRQRAEAALASLNDSTKREKSKNLNLPVITPAAYLDADWHGFLSAVAFLRPTWTDIDLKKKLLDLSVQVQLRLPELENIPDIVQVLHQLEIPYSTCFLSLERIQQALKANMVPYLSLHGRWVPITGFDSGRNGYYYYTFTKSKSWNWTFTQEMDLVQQQKESSFGNTTQPNQKPRPLQKFIASHDLSEHILDIGGVGMILGDSALIGKNEQKAAFLVEQGDVFYQIQDNYPDAAESYRQAGKLFPNDQIYARMLYLKRRYESLAHDPGDYQNLFLNHPPEWMETMGLDSVQERSTIAEVLAGKLGAYLMINWTVNPFWDSTKIASPGLDTALFMYSKLHKQDPLEPLYLDSLANLMIRRDNWLGAEKLLEDLAGLFPVGNESAIYRLAWTKFRLGKIKEVTDLLNQCSGFSGEAKYLTLQAAVAMDKKKFGKAFSALSKSLKLDKTLSESHVLLEAYYRHAGEKVWGEVHRTWKRRSS